MNIYIHIYLYKYIYVYINNSRHIIRIRKQILLIQNIPLTVLLHKYYLFYVLFFNFIYICLY